MVINSKFKLIIGLGNPGEEYKNTYHNVGFLFVDYLNRCQVSGVRCQILKSNVYMNQSGNFVRLALKKYKTKPEELLIVHDDSDIELGKYKISFGRGSAGHHGVESIIKSLGTKNFWRLRIGIRKAGLPAEAYRAKAGKFVLKKITPADRITLEQVFKAVEVKLRLLFGF